MVSSLKRKKQTMTARSNLIALLNVFGGNRTLLAKALATSPRSIGRWINCEHPIREEMETVIHNMLAQYQTVHVDDEVVEAMCPSETQDTPAPSPDTEYQSNVIPRTVLLVEGYVRGQYILTVAKSVENTDTAIRVLGEDGCLIIMSTDDTQLTIERVPSTHEQVQFYYQVQQSFNGELQMYQIDTLGWHLRVPTLENIRDMKNNNIGENKMVILSKEVSQMILD